MRSPQHARWEFVYAAFCAYCMKCLRFMCCFIVLQHRDNEKCFAGMHTLCCACCVRKKIAHVAVAAMCRERVMVPGVRLTTVAPACAQALLSLVLLMTSLVLGDGVLTPAQSGAPGRRAKTGVGMEPNQAVGTEMGHSLTWRTCASARQTVWGSCCMPMCVSAQQLA